MRNCLIILALLTLVFTSEVLSQVQFRQPIYITLNTLPGKAETLWIGVSGDGPNPPGTIIDNTYLVDNTTDFGPWGAYREAQFPGDPPPPFEVYSKLIDIPGRSGMGMLKPYDFRGFTEDTQVDTFQIKTNGDAISGPDASGYVASSTITLSWESNLRDNGTLWVLKKRVGVNYSTVVADMSAPGVTSWTDPNTNGDDMVRYLIIKTGATSVIPVEMTAFTAIAEGMNAKLQWRTATETDNYGFEIERRAISSNAWSTVGFVPGAGTSASPREYSYSDNNLAVGEYVYRIKQIDNGGDFKYSLNTQVKIQGAPKAFTLSQNYPNPFNPSTMIRFTVPENGNVRLRIYNLIGQEVASLFNGPAEAGNRYEMNFDASQLSSGLYFSVLEFGGKRLISKMMLMK